MVICEKTRQRMNDYGAKGIPFLCAVNYELTEGFVLPYPLEEKEVWWNMEGITNQRLLQRKSKVVISDLCL